MRSESLFRKQGAQPNLGGALQGVLSYVILRPVMTAAGFIGQLCGVYGDGQLRFDRVYLYTVLVSNFSQARTGCTPRIALRDRMTGSGGQCNENDFQKKGNGSRVALWIQVYAFGAFVL